jgi:hypothetical protein
MLIDTNQALDALDESISWKLRPALDPDARFDSIASKLHRIFPELTIAQIDLLLGDLKRDFARDMREAEWSLYQAFRCTIGAED